MPEILAPRESAVRSPSGAPDARPIAAMRTCVRVDRTTHESRGTRRPTRTARPCCASAARHGVIAFHRYKRGDGFVYRCKRCIGEAVTRRHRRIRALLVQRGRRSVRGLRATSGARSTCTSTTSTRARSPSRCSMGVGKALAAFREEAKQMRARLRQLPRRDRGEADRVAAAQGASYRDELLRLRRTGPHGVVVSTPAFHAGSGSSTLPGGTSPARARRLRTPTAAARRRPPPSRP